MTYDYFKILVEQGGLGKAIDKAISDHRSTDTYKAAQISDSYYNQRNITILNFHRMINTITGGQIEDRYSANYKVQTLWYRLGVTQILNYLLGSGCNFDTDIKKKLGRKWDSVVMEAAKYAAVHGRSFTFWNHDHAECFHYLDTASEPGFCPLYAKNGGGLTAGIRYWWEADEGGNGKSYLACTLYEPDGLTGFETNRNTHDLEIIDEKRGYIATTSTNGLGVSSTTYSNPETFPIKELCYNAEKLPMLEGHRETIDTHDMILNGLANTVDDTAEIYWIIKSFGGMNGEADMAKARDYIKRLHMISVNAEGEDAKAETVDIPVEARKELLAQLRKSFFEGFMLVDMDSLSAAQKTTQEIQAAFTAQDNLAFELEFPIIDHIQDVLSVAGLEGEPFFRRNKIQNVTEATQAVVTAAAYLPPEMIPKLLPFLTPEQSEEAAQYSMDMDASRIGNAATGGTTEPGADDE